MGIRARLRGMKHDVPQSTRTFDRNHEQMTDEQIALLQRSRGSDGPVLMKNRIEIRGNVLDALLTADPEAQAEARALIAEINSIPAVNRKDMYE